MQFPLHTSRARAFAWCGGTCAVLVLLFVVLFWRLGTPTFWDPDEAHYAQTTRELIATGDVWAPSYNQQPFYDKPILFHQAQAAAMVVFGQNELGARAVPALAALALVLITAWIGASLVSLEVGLVGALLVATSPAVFALARYAILDTLFTALLFGGVSLLAVAALRDRPRWQYPGYVLIALAVLTKGPLALVLCGATMGIALAASPDVRRRLLGLRWVLGLGLVIALSAPWFIYMYLRFGQDFVSGYVLDENLRLFAANRFARQPGALFYFQILAVGLLPWTGVVVGRIVDDARALIAGRPRDGVEVLLWSWTIAIVGFFTLSTFKLDHYVFPAAPALCLLCARARADVRANPMAPEHRSARIGLHMVGPLLVILGAGAGYFVIARLDLPAAAMAVPIALTGAGVLIAIRANVQGGRPPVVPWTALAALTVTYAGIVLFVMPALEAQKVVPDVSRWIASRAEPTDRIASFRLNRWNTAFRFYVDRHVTWLETPEEATAFFTRDEPFYCVMLEPAFEEFVAHGVPLRKVYMREGMWATSGRALWREAAPLTRFVVVTSGLPRQMERDAGDHGVRPEQQRALDQQGALIVQ